MSVAAPSSTEVLSVGPLEVCPDDHLARAEGKALILSIRELCLLTELARRADRIMARDELFRLVWGKEMRPGERSVDVYVRKLRVKLEYALPGWSCIHPHFGFGDRLAPERASVGDPKAGHGGSQVVHSSGKTSGQTRIIDQGDE